MKYFRHDAVVAAYIQRHDDVTGFFRVTWVVRGWYVLARLVNGMEVQLGYYADKDAAEKKLLAVRYTYGLTHSESLPSRSDTP